MRMFWIEFCVKQQGSNLSPSSSLCLSSGNHSWRIFQQARFQGFDCKINGQALGQCSCTAWAGLSGQHKHWVFPTGAAGHTLLTWVKKLLPLLLHWLISRVKVLMIYEFWVVMSHWQEDFMRTYNQPKPHSLLCSIFQSHIGVWVNIRHRNKNRCSELNPVQSSRSKFTTCLRKGSLLRFLSKSTATSDGNSKNLEPMSGMILNRLQPMFVAEFVANECYISRPRWDLHWLIFNLKQSATQNQHLLCCWPNIYHLISKICPNFQVLWLFWGWWSAWWALSKKCARNFTPKSVPNAVIGTYTRFAVSKSGISCLALKFSSSNHTITILYAKIQLSHRLLNMMYCFLRKLKWTHGSVTSVVNSD